MGKSAPSPPPAPDPRATAQAQSEFNLDAAKQTAELNRVNQFTPQGSLVYSTTTPNEEAFNRAWQERQQQYLTDPGYDINNVAHAANAARDEKALREQFGANPIYSATTTLSPEQQRLYDLSTQAQQTYGEAALSQLNQAKSALSSPFAFNAPEMQYRPDFTGIGDPNQSRDAVEQALMARLNPSLERERAALENRLANQGITMGSEAWRTGMDDYGRQANDARLGAILNAGAEQSRMFGLGLGQSQFANAARQMSLQEQLALRAQPINEASALLTGGQVAMPQFSNVPQVQVQAPDYAGAAGQAYAGQVGAANTKAQQNAQSNAAAGQAAAAAASIGAMAIIA